MNNTNPRFNYTGHGWEGDNYSPDLSTKDIAKQTREELKKKFPKCKFSVTMENYSGGSSISINLMSAPFEALTNGQGHSQINHYYMDNNDLTSEALEVMTYAKNYIQSFNFDDSDGMIDYFHTNFYVHFSIGKWSKNFVNTSQKTDTYKVNCYFEKLKRYEPMAEYTNEYHAIEYAKSSVNRNCINSATSAVVIKNGEVIFRIDAQDQTNEKPIKSSPFACTNEQALNAYSNSLTNSKL